MAAVRGWPRGNYVASFDVRALDRAARLRNVWRSPRLADKRAGKSEVTAV
jgi:hypothetical protein